MKKIIILFILLSNLILANGGTVLGVNVTYTFNGVVQSDFISKTDPFTKIYSDRGTSITLDVWSDVGGTSPYLYSVFNQQTSYYRDFSSAGANHQFLPISGADRIGRWSAGVDNDFFDFRVYEQVVPLTPPNGSIQASSTISFGWQGGPPDVSEYYLQVDDNSNFSSPIYSSSVGNVVLQPLTGFPNNGETFYWRVRGRYAGEWGPYTNTWSFVNGTVTPILTVTPTDIDLGTHSPSYSFSRTFTVQNTGGGTLSGNISESVSWITSVSPTTFSLSAGQSQTITIQGNFPSNAGSFSTNVSATSNGGNQNVYVHGVVVLPSISVTVNLLNFSDTPAGESSSPQSYTVSGDNLLSNINIVVSDGFELSFDSNSGYGNSLSLTRTNGTVANTTIYVRFSPLSVQTYSGNILHSSTNITDVSIALTGNGITGIEDLDIISGIPQNYQLENNYPNPFNPSTRIEFGLPEESNASLKVYDITGEEVAILLASETLPAGRYSYNLVADNLPSGVYIYVLLSQSNASDKTFKSVKKMILLK